MANYLIIILFFVLQSQAGRIKREPDTYDFDVCPESHPYAFSRGHKCCSQQNLDEPEFWISDACQADSIACPAPSCEDLKEECFGNLKVSGASIIGGEYLKIEYSEGNRPIFKKENRNSCIWWHRPDRHWWIGDCKNVGASSGFAYLQEDTSCPNLPNLSNPTWRRESSDEILNQFSVEIKLPQRRPLEGDGVELIAFTGTAGVNVIIRKGKYKQTCRFVFRNGQFRCEKF
jgi:hypothetical protein